MLTWEGVRPIRELAGGTHGSWVGMASGSTPFYSFGVQPLMRVVVSRNGPGQGAVRDGGAPVVRPQW